MQANSLPKLYGRYTTLTRTLWKKSLKSCVQSQVGSISAWR